MKTSLMVRLLFLLIAGMILSSCFFPVEEDEGRPSYGEHRDRDEHHEHHEHHEENGEYGGYR